MTIFEEYPRRNFVHDIRGGSFAETTAGKALSAVINALTVEKYTPSQSMDDSERRDYHDAVYGRIVASAGRSVISLTTGFTLLGLHERLPDTAQTPAILTGVGIVLGAFIRCDQTISEIVNDHDASRLKSDVRKPHAWLTLPFSKSAYLHFRNRHLKTQTSAT